MSDADLSHILPELRDLAVPIDSLVPDPVNARSHPKRNLDATKASLASFTQRKPIVARKSDRVVEAGNATLEVAKLLGWSHVAAVFPDDDEKTATAYALADNRTAELAEWEKTNLASLLFGLDRDLAIGWSDDELDRLLKDLRPPPPPDHGAESIAEEFFSEPGEVYWLGDHFLVCGDSTDPRIVSALLDADRDAEDIAVDLVVTDPPYGVGYEEKNKRLAGFTDRGGNNRQKNWNDGSGGAVTGDAKVDLEQLGELWRDSLGLANEFMRDGAPIYAFTTSSFEALPITMKAFTDAGFYGSSPLIWSKDCLALSLLDYHPRSELILYGWKRGGKHPWFGGRDKTNVIEFPRPKRNKDHPTEKPVGLLAILIENSSTRGDVVFDPFAGSGSTLFAAEQLGRKARLVEKDPRYCDAIRRRWYRYATNAGRDPGTDSLEPKETSNG